MRAHWCMRAHRAAKLKIDFVLLTNDMKPKEINVLIACEESQAECEAFRARGFNAYSCDVQLCRYGGHIEWHIPGDVTPYLKGKTTFRTQDGKNHRLKKWHFILAHPPCTFLCKVSSVHMWVNGKIDDARHSKMNKARSFFLTCLAAKADFVAVENPLPMAMAELPPPDCFIQPYWFGVPYSKKTLFWLRNLPPIMADSCTSTYREFVHSSRGKYRSRTFPEVAEALAHQWGDYIIEQYKCSGE